MNEMSQEAVQVLMDTAKALTGSMAGQAAMEIFVPQRHRRAGLTPHPAHMRAAARIAERVAERFREAVSEEVSTIAREIAEDPLGLKE